MAGAGYKLFNTGDVLTAAQVNTYLMEQSVMVFADAAARTTALTGVVAEGMLSYLKDTNAVEVYNGSAWVASDDPNAIQNTIVDAKGDLITATAADTPARLAVGTNDFFLQAASGETTGLKWAGSWTAYTPTVTANTGTITTSSASGRYIKIGKFVFVTVFATVTTNGTGGDYLIVSAPFSSSGLASTALYRETAVTGGVGQVYTSGSSFLLATTANGYPAANGYIFRFGIGYEVA